MVTLTIIRQDSHLIGENYFCPIETVEQTGYKGMVVYSMYMTAAADLGFTTLLISQVITVAFYSEREKSDKFCSEALIST